MIAINILMLLLLISFSIRTLLLEKQESCVCAFRAARASGPAQEEQCHPRGAPKVPAVTSQAPCPRFATCPAPAGSSLPRHQLQAKATSVEPAGETRRGLTCN